MMYRSMKVRGLLLAAIVVGLGFVVGGVSSPAAQTHDATTQQMQTTVNTSLPQAVGTYDYSAPTQTSLPARISTPVYPNPPEAVSLSEVGLNLSRTGTPLVWGVETKGDLSIWLGYLTDAPNVTIADSHPLVHWNHPFYLRALRVSPNRQQVAAIIENRDSDGDTVPNRWLYVINLVNITVQSVPSRSASNYGLYYAHASDIVGWLNDSSLMFDTLLSPVTASTDGQSLNTSKFPPYEWSTTSSTLSPDGKKLFASVAGGADGTGYWLFDADGNNPHKLAGLDNVVPAYESAFSPSGTQVAFLSPSSADFTKMNLWVFDLAKNTKQAVQTSSGWSGGFSWSLDGQSIAFLVADHTPTTSDAWYEDPDRTATNLYLTSSTGLAPRQVTAFENVHNSTVTWTPDGKYLLFASSTVEQAGANDLVVASVADGKITRLMAGTAENRLVHPVAVR